jgi:hypothetical protein
MTAATLDRERLAKLLGLLGSDQPGEVVNAARQAERLRREAGLSWSDIVALGGGRVGSVREVRSPHGGYTRELIERCLGSDQISSWEIEFLCSVRRQRRPLSVKQIAVLDQIVGKALGAEARAA